MTWLICVQGGDQVQVEEPPPQVMMNEPVMRGYQTNGSQMRTHQVSQVMMNDPGVRGYQAPQVMMHDQQGVIYHHQSPQMNDMGMRVQQSSQYQSVHQRRPIVQERPFLYPDILSQFVSHGLLFWILSPPFNVIEWVPSCLMFVRLAS